VERCARLDRAPDKYPGAGNIDGGFGMIAAIGAFDGFHKGHQALLKRAGELARSAGSVWGTVTFSQHPDTLLSSPSFKSLFTMQERLILEKFFSVPETGMMEFTKEVAGMTPHEFLDRIAREFNVNGVVVGESFRFGAGRMGTTATLETECRERGWVSGVVPLTKDDGGGSISSTMIRVSAASGDMERVWNMLGYPFFCFGRVIHGSERGRSLGFPTANLDIPPNKAAIRGGVYATLVLALGKWHIGAANAGFNPTFGDIDRMRFEVNLMNFGDDLYGQDIAVFLLKHVRDERRFGDQAGLKEQIARDAEAIKGIGLRALQEHSDLWKRFGEII
jgi:riboflavin kinase/FMN adenylyltransferase